MAHLFSYFKWANVLLGEFFCNLCRRKNRRALIKSEYCSFFNLPKEKLMVPIIMHFLIGKSKRYCVSYICMGLKSDWYWKIREQIKWLAQRKTINNFIRSLIGYLQKSVIQQKLYMRKHFFPKCLIFKGINKKL